MRRKRERDFSEKEKEERSESKKCGNEKRVSTTPLNLTQSVSLSKKPKEPLDTSPPFIQNLTHQPPLPKDHAPRAAQLGSGAPTAGTRSDHASSSSPHVDHSQPHDGMICCQPCDAPLDPLLSTEKELSVPKETAQMSAHAIIKAWSSLTAPHLPSPPFDQHVSSTVRRNPRPNTSTVSSPASDLHASSTAGFSPDFNANLEDKVFAGSDSNVRPKRVIKKPSWLKGFK